MKNKIYPREKYLSKIRPFYDSDLVKVITGIRRSGKTSILKAIISELESRNLSKRIIYLPLDKRGYQNAHLLLYQNHRKKYSNIFS